MTAKEFVKSKGRFFMGVAETVLPDPEYVTIGDRRYNVVKTLFVFYIRVWTWGANYRTAWPD